MKEYADSTPDLYNSIAQDKRDVKAEIKLWNGLITGNIRNTTGAQETDSQTNGLDKESAEVLSGRLKDRRKYIKNINKVFGTKISIDYKTRYKVFIKENIEQEETEQDK